MKGNKQKAQRCQYTVAFNLAAKQLHDQLAAQGLTSRPFHIFVRDAYHNAVDELRMKAKSAEPVTAAEA
jgi:hypothetical protein